MFFNYDIEILEIENSTICNARCPQCTRQAKGQDLSWFEQSYLKTSIFEKIPQTVYDKLKYIVFEGTMGDPCAAPNLIATIEYIKTRAKNAEISVVTNGGLKNVQFWKRLAHALGDRGYVVFAIDGLEKTNHVYRIGVEWNKLLKNVSSFIKAGGRAQWQFIVFRHNEHELDLARQFATDLGFEKFYSRKTSRFIYEKIMNFSNIGADGVKLEPPLRDEYIHTAMKQDISSLSIESILNNNLDKDISCAAKNKNGIYIDFKGRIFPCCFISGMTYLYENVPMHDGFYDLWSKYKDEIDLVNNSWDDIFQSRFFTEIEQSWKANMTKNMMFPCVSTCSKSCSKANDPWDLGRHQIILVKNNI